MIKRFCRIDIASRVIQHGMFTSKKSPQKNTRADFLNAVYFRRNLTCTLGLTNDLTDGGQLRAKPHLCEAKPDHVLNPFLVLEWPPSIKSLVNPIVHAKSCATSITFKTSDLYESKP